MKYSVRALAPAIVTLALFAAGCSQPEPAPICNMEQILRQRELAAVPPRPVPAPPIIPPSPEGGVAGSAPPPPPQPPLIEPPFNSVNITDYTILQKIWVRDVAVRRTPTGTVEVLSRVVNCTDFPLQVEARTQFFDAQRTPAEPASAWRRMYLSPRSYETYQEKSTQTAAVSMYLVELREGR